MMSLHRYAEKGIKSAHLPQKITKPRLFFNFILYQNTLVKIRKGLILIRKGQKFAK